MTVSNTIFLTRNSEWSIPQTVCNFFSHSKVFVSQSLGSQKKFLMGQIKSTWFRRDTSPLNESQACVF